MNINSGSETPPFVIKNLGDEENPIYKQYFNRLDSSVATIMTEAKYLAKYPQDKIDGNKAFTERYGKIIPQSLTNPFRNLMWEWLWFNDVSVFTPAANAFIKSKEDSKTNKFQQPSYTPFLKGTSQYKHFWKRELSRILHGYEPVVNGKPCGVWIPGVYYYYLNYTIMEQVLEIKNAKGKVIDAKSEYTFPKFCAMDYYLFLEIHARNNPDSLGLPLEYKLPVILAKSRRLGFSYKGAAFGGYYLFFNKNKNSIILSEEYKDPHLVMIKIEKTLDHLNKYTEFGGATISRNVKKDKANDIEMGIVDYKTLGKQGRQTKISTLSVGKGNDDKAAGAASDYTMIEEAGKVKQLSSVWAYTRPLMMKGAYYISNCIIGGTGGDLTSSQDFAKMFYNPKADKIASYKNIYDGIHANGSECGLFLDMTLFYTGGVIEVDKIKYHSLDENGNPLRWVADLLLNESRKAAKKTKSAADMRTIISQECKTPMEAFMKSSSSIMPIVELQAHHSKMELNGGFQEAGTLGHLIERDGSIEFIPDLDGKIDYIDEYPIKSSNNNKEGGLKIFEQPFTLDKQDTPPKDLYLISCDTVGNTTGDSFISIIVYKTGKYWTTTQGDYIVAEYFGRDYKDPLGYCQKLLLLLSKFYNAKVTFENDRDGGIPQFFLNKNEVHRLLSVPVVTYAKSFKKTVSTTLRDYGHSMSNQRYKEMAEKFIYEWLLKDRPAMKVEDEYGGFTKVVLKNYELIKSKGLIEELMAYDRIGNYDRVMAFAGIVIQLEERYNEDKIEELSGGDDEELAYLVSKLKNPRQQGFINGANNGANRNRQKYAPTKTTRELFDFLNNNDYDKEQKEARKTARDNFSSQFKSKTRDY